MKYIATVEYNYQNVPAEIVLEGDDEQAVLAAFRAKCIEFSAQDIDKRWTTAEQIAFLDQKIAERWYYHGFHFQLSTGWVQVCFEQYEPDPAAYTITDYLRDHPDYELVQGNYTIPGIYRDLLRQYKNLDHNHSCFVERNSRGAIVTIWSYLGSRPRYHLPLTRVL